MATCYEYISSILRTMWLTLSFGTLHYVVKSYRYVERPMRCWFTVILKQCLILISTCSRFRWLREGIEFPLVTRQWEVTGVSGRSKKEKKRRSVLGLQTLQFCESRVVSTLFRWRRLIIQIRLMFPRAETRARKAKSSGVKFLFVAVVNVL